jgi:hypothetical protein
VQQQQLVCDLMCTNALLGASDISARLLVLVIAAVFEQR